MEDEVISLSSGSEDDSDIEVVGVYSGTGPTAEATPFIRRGECWQVAGPFVINLAAQIVVPLPLPRKRRRRDPNAPPEVVDSDNYCLRDEGDREPVSPLSNRCKRTKTLSEFKGPHTRCSQKEEQLGEDPTVLEAKDSDIRGCNQGLLRESSTEPPEQENTVKCSDKYISKSPVKSPCLPTSKSAEEGACSPKSSGQITQESQPCPGVPESLVGGCALLQSMNSKNNTCQTNLNVISNETQPSSTVEEAHLTCPVSMSPHVPTEKREEPGSAQTLPDDTLPPAPQSIGSPHHIPDNIDPLTSSNDCAAHEAGQKDTYSLTQIPSGRSLSPPPPEDLTQREPQIPSGRSLSPPPPEDLTQREPQIPSGRSLSPPPPEDLTQREPQIPSGRSLSPPPPEDRTQREPQIPSGRSLSPPPPEDLTQREPQIPSGRSLSPPPPEDLTQREPQIPSGRSLSPPPPEDRTQREPQIPSGRSLSPPPPEDLTQREPQIPSGRSLSPPPPEDLTQREPQIPSGRSLSPPPPEDRTQREPQIPSGRSLSPPPPEDLTQREPQIPSGRSLSPPPPEGLTQREPQIPSGRPLSPPPPEDLTQREPQIPSGRSLSPPPPEDLTQREPGDSSSPTSGIATSSSELKHPKASSSPPSKPCSPSPDSDQQARLPSPLHPQPATGSVAPCHSLRSRRIKNLPNRTPTPTSKDILAGESSDWQLKETEANLATVSLPYVCSIPSDPPMCSIPSDLPWNEDMNEEPGHRSHETCSVLNPVPGMWRGGSVVCPVQYKKQMTLMAGPVQGLEDVEEEDDGFGEPEQLCRRSLSLVYSTMQENYHEGTLQLLSDLLHPQFYPPVDITSHLLRGILLDHQSPDYFCQVAHSLLLRTQRHHHTDKTTIPWDWELLMSVMAEQKHPRRHRCEVVRMLLQYVLQTLEDDFRVKLPFGDLHHSIAKATLSCDLRFTQVRDVIDWLFAAVMKSTGDKANVTADTEVKAKNDRDEHFQMVVIFQKMLSLALEVDRSPALSASKLCQELFHTIDSVPLRREHRMLFLKTMNSRLLKCKLLELLLGHACLQKNPLPMSLSLVLHYLNNATLTPDPTDGAEGWRRWEELIQLLWMLLLSYREVMKGHLRCSVTERAGYSRAPIQTVNDTLLQSSVQEAVETFLSRSQADLGQALPPHIHKSLTFLQDHLLASSQH